LFCATVVFAKETPARLVLFYHFGHFTVARMLDDNNARKKTRAMNASLNADKDEP
jgi:hypothetical protein